MHAVDLHKAHHVHFIHHASAAARHAVHAIAVLLPCPCRPLPCHSMPCHAHTTSYMMPYRAKAMPRHACRAWAPYVQEGRLPSEGKLKEMIRKGVPPTLRAWVWMEVSGASAKRASCSPNYYSTMAMAGESGSPHLKQIDQVCLCSGCGMAAHLPPSRGVRSGSGALDLLLCSLMCLLLRLLLIAVVLAVGYASKARLALQHAQLLPARAGLSLAPERHWTRVLHIH